MRWLRDWWWRRKPRCAAPPPWRLTDALPCCRPTGHETWDTTDGGPWHADGTGYIWDTTRWRWMGDPARMEGTHDAHQHGPACAFGAPDCPAYGETP